MLRWLRPCFGFFPIFIHIQIIRSPIQAKTPKLNGGTINGMISGHDDCLLLLHDASLIA